MCDEGRGAKLGWVAPLGFGHEVPLRHLGLGGAHVLCTGLDGLDDLDLVSVLILILIVIPPEGNVHLPLLGDCLREDPPTMAILNTIRQAPGRTQGAPRGPQWATGFQTGCT